MSPAVVVGSDAARAALLCSGAMAGGTGTGSGRYRTLERLATGGMGEVELAMRTEGQFRRLYAIKRLRESMKDDEGAREMFLDEARLAGLVRHPNVVSVLDVGEDERGPYLAMDFVEGISAGALLRWSGKNGVSLPVQVCLRVIREIALGLHAAHELADHDGQPLGMVHRDVSPQNILIGFDGIARIADFGIAKAAGRTTRTTTGLLKGKAGYMSPEQLRFEEPDRRSDLFSLAIVLYELLAGRRLYRSETDLQTARRILSEPPPDIDDARGDVPPEVVELLFSSLAKDPASRPRDAQEVARRLDVVIGALALEEGAIDVGEYIREHFAGQRADLSARLSELRTKASAMPVSPVSPAPRSRRGLIAALVVALVSLSLAIGGWSLGLFGPDAPAPASASIAPPPTPASPPVPALAARAPQDPGAPDTAAAPAIEPRVTAPSPRPRGRRPRRRAEAPASEHLFDWE